MNVSSGYLTDQLDPRTFDPFLELGQWNAQLLICPRTTKGRGLRTRPSRIGPIRQGFGACDTDSPSRRQVLHNVSKRTRQTSMDGYPVRLYTILGEENPNQGPRTRITVRFRRGSASTGQELCYLRQPHCSPIGMGKEKETRHLFIGLRQNKRGKVRHSRHQTRKENSSMIPVDTDQ